MKLSDKLSSQLQGLGLEEMAKKARELEEALMDASHYAEKGAKEYYQSIAKGGE